jgi:hypothetical protein
MCLVKRNMTNQYFKFLNNLRLEDVIVHGTLDNWSVGNPYSYRTWYSEDIQGRDTLLITVGDSWTWGDHLGTIDWDKSVNDPIRLQQVFGRLLADKLDADWVNIAEPGCSNYWMIEKLQDIEQNIINAKYKNIKVVITLTEDLREATYTKRFDVVKPYQHFWNTSKSIAGFLIKVEDFLLHNLEEYANGVTNAEFYVSRAFTDNWPPTQSSLLLDSTWCDVIQQKVNYSNYTKPVPFIGQMSINPLTKNFIDSLDSQTKQIYREEFLEIMQLVEQRWNFLGASDYNLKGSTCHPNPDGHALWADYLFTKIR